MRVADAITNPKFLDGTQAIEYDTADWAGNSSLGAYTVRQVSVAKDKTGRFLVERHRTFKSVSNSPWPKWHAIRGSSAGEYGFFGLWLPHLNDLLADCKLVELDTADRVGLLDT
jgi:hypothetical protein